MVLPHLKFWIGLGAKPSKPVQTDVLFHYAMALFMKFTSVERWEEQPWTARLFKTLVQFVHTNHNTRQYVADLPEIAFFLTAPDEDL